MGRMGCHMDAGQFVLLCTAAVFFLAAPARSFPLAPPSCKVLGSLRAPGHAVSPLPRKFSEPSSTIAHFSVVSFPRHLILQGLVHGFGYGGRGRRNIARRSGEPSEIDDIEAEIERLMARKAALKAAAEKAASQEMDGGDEEKAVVPRGTRRDDSENAKYLANLGSYRQWDLFHKGIIEKMTEELGEISVRNIIELDMEARGSKRQKDSGRGEDAARAREMQKKNKAPGALSTRADLNKRGFKYVTKEGDFFVKVLLTGEGLSTEQDRQQEADRLGSLSDQVKAGELPSNVSPEELQELKAMQLPGMDLLELISGQDSNEEVRLEEILGQGGDKSWRKNRSAGLILNVPKELSAKIQAASAPKSDGVSSKVAASGIAQQIVLGSFESSCCLRDARCLRVPAMMAHGDLREMDFLARARNTLGATEDDLPAGAFLASEWIDLEHVSSPSLIGTVGEQLARLHLTTQGLEDNFGFHVDTYLGQRRQDNARDNDLLSFFVQRRLDPEIAAASRRPRRKAPRAQGARLVESDDRNLDASFPELLGPLGIQALERIMESYVWRELVFAGANKAGPALLHGDLWLGNMAVDVDEASGKRGRPLCLGASSWFGPPEFDLAVGETFGMPGRFFEAYHHYLPRQEGHTERMLIYRLFHLLAHLNQPATTRRSPKGAYVSDNLLGGGRATLTGFSTGGVLNPGKHSYRTEMEWITRGAVNPRKEYRREVVKLLHEIIALDPAKTGAAGSKFEFRRSRGTGSPKRGPWKRNTPRTTRRDWGLLADPPPKQANKPATNAARTVQRLKDAALGLGNRSSNPDNVIEKVSKVDDLEELIRNGLDLENLADPDVSGLGVMSVTLSSKEGGTGGGSFAQWVFDASEVDTTSSPGSAPISEKTTSKGGIEPVEAPASEETGVKEGISKDDDAVLQAAQNVEIDEKTELDLKQRLAQDLKSLGITLTLKDDEEDVLDVPDLPVPGQGPWKPKGGSKRDRSRDHVAIDEEDPSSDRVIGVAGELPKNNAAGENKRAGTDARDSASAFSKSEENYVSGLKNAGITLSRKDGVQGESDVLVAPDLPLPGQGPWKPKGGRERNRSRDYTAVPGDTPEIEVAAQERIRREMRSRGISISPVDEETDQRSNTSNSRPPG